MKRRRVAKVVGVIATLVVSSLVSLGGVDSDIAAASSPDPESATGIEKIPNAGESWPRCQADDESYCLESASVIDAFGDERTVEGGAPYTYCHRGKGPLPDGVCVADGSFWLEIGYSHEFTEADLDSTYHWKVRMGAFSPDVLMLGNTQKTVVSGDATAGWSLEIWVKPALKAYKAGCWGENNACRGEATADSVDHAISGYLRVLGISQSWPSVESTAVRDALRGTFITTNGMSQSWSFSAETFYVTAIGPHFMTDGTTVVPGYVKVFLPAAYVLGLRGYLNLAEVTPSNLEVTVSGEPVTPTLTIQEGGILVDTGVRHFSAPNPTVKLLRRGSEKASPTPVSPSSIVPKDSAQVALKRGRSTSLAKIYRARPREVTKWVVSGRCFVRGARLVASAKPGLCRVTASVKRGPRHVVVARKVFRVT